MKKPDLLHADTNASKIKVEWKILRWPWVVQNV